MKRKYLLLPLMVLALALPGCQGSSIFPPSNLCAPSDLVSIPVSYSEIHLTWQDNSDDEYGFRVKCKGGDSDYYEVADLPANKRHFEHSGLDPLTKYRHYVQVYNETGSANSEIVETTTLSGIDILDYEVEVTPEHIRVTGHARNTMNEMLARVTFTYWFYDANDIFLRSIDSAVSNIPPLTIFEFVFSGCAYSEWDRVEYVTLAVTGVDID